METLIEKKIVEILNEHRHLVRITKTGDSRMGLLTTDFEIIGADLFSLYKAEIAKWRELVNTEITDEKIEDKFPYARSYANHCAQEGAKWYKKELRQRISEFEKELNLKTE